MTANAQSFRYWLDDNPAGPLFTDDDPRFPSAVYALSGGPDGTELVIDQDGACFGFVEAGIARVTEPGFNREAAAGQWFATASSCALVGSENCRVLVVQRLGYRGIPMCGGPIEDLGRLRYIDGCSDTLLACPPILGDPCLNHLHFPPGIDQTEHTHPSLRAGIVARGRGECITPRGVTSLVPGLVFVIPRDGLHRFRTADEGMDVIAYHPDSDWGPTHEQHPMVNRTLVGGRKIDNTGGRHQEAEIVVGQAR